MIDPTGAVAESLCTRIKQHERSVSLKLESIHRYDLSLWSTAGELDCYSNSHSIGIKFAFCVSNL